MGVQDKALKLYLAENLPHKMSDHFAYKVWPLGITQTIQVINPLTA